MKLFISWSGETIGLPVAQRLQTWLPDVLPEVEAWMSPDIPAGEVGVQALVNALRSSDGGIVIVTPESQLSPWVLFETGAFALKGNLFPLLVGVPKWHLRQPYESFQFKTCDQHGVRSLILDILAAADVNVPEAEVREKFAASWPHLEEVIQIAVERSGKISGRYFHYGEAAPLVTQAEKRAAEAIARAEEQELKADALKSLLFHITRYADHLDEPDVLERVREEMKMVCHIVEHEDLGEYSEGQFFEPELPPDHV